MTAPISNASRFLEKIEYFYSTPFIDFKTLFSYCYWFKIHDKITENYFIIVQPCCFY